MRDTAVALGSALFAYMLGVTLIITLVPFEFAWPADWHFTPAGDLHDILANVVLFVPLGFFYCFARGARPSLTHVLAAGVLLSSAIELAQLFESSRNTTASDVAANGIGAWLGAAAAHRVGAAPRIDGRLVGWLALELPLMGLVYLLVPLLWLDALASEGELVRSLMALILGVVGAVLLGGVQRHYLGPARAAAPATTAALAALWFAAGAWPTIATRPLTAVGGLVFVGLVTLWYGSRPPPRAGANRRFEAPLLKRAAVFYAAYLALAAYAPLSGGTGGWTFTFALPSITAEVEIVRLLEVVGAFTLVGYMAAEFRGRVHSRYGEAIRWVLGWGTALALPAELVRGYDPVASASALHGLLLIAAALFGGWLYHLQRAHVRRLLAG